MRNIMSHIVWVTLLIGVGLGLTSCGESAGGGSKSTVFLTAEGQEKCGLYADVYDAAIVGTVADDTFWITITSSAKDQAGGTTLSRYSDVVLEEYRVTYYRVDGNPNVPDPFTIQMQFPIPAGGSGDIETLVLRREAKLKSPLRELALGGGEGNIQFNALIDFYGKDLAGNHVSVSYNLPLFVGDY